MDRQPIEMWYPNMRIQLVPPEIRAIRLKLRRLRMIAVAVNGGGQFP